MENNQLMENATNEILEILNSLPKSLANAVLFGIVANWLRVLILMDNERTLH
jgi:hypothetical protein